MKLIRFFVIFISFTFSAAGEHKDQSRKIQEQSPPNIVIFLVDDMGWNQVGYHANPVGNNEIKTPHIDEHAFAGIELDRGYMTPWCGPSRAAIMTGRTNVFNGNISSLISSFDDDIGYVAGLPPGTKTIATAFKEYGESIGKPYKAYYNGKWGIGGTAWTNTPLGMGFDAFRGFWGNGIETCDGVVPSFGVVPTYRPRPFDGGFGSHLLYALPGYFEQHPDIDDVAWCPFIMSLPDTLLTDEEKFVACKTRPRELPKLLDLDLLDNIQSEILSHNYDEGPILEVFATAMLHVPIAYPKQYDRDAADSLPEYFQPGKEKPIPTNDDLRLSTNNAVRFVDDLFGSTMQALKDAGQWNNTIVWFTSDNGGAMYPGAANNNYPLRASKFSPFEGGTRVPQFLAGGWIENNLPTERKDKSNTYVFPSDIAPTLLDMAGGDVNFLLGGKSGGPYGNAMWEFIRNSIDVNAPSQSSQKARMVSYNKDLYFDVQLDRTMKYIHTGDDPIIVPRLWSPIWPTKNDLMIDSNYLSVNPCRPDGQPSECCYLDIENDFQETNPLAVDCDDYLLMGKNLFEIEGGCEADENGIYNSQVCIEAGDYDGGVNPSDLSLWSQMGAAGPFTNSKGVPIDGLPMQCVCDSADYRFGGKFDYFNVNLMGQSQCSQSFLGLKPLNAIPCDGTLALPLKGNSDELYIELREEGIDILRLKIVNFLEDYQALFLGLAETSQTFNQYLNRQGFTEWANAYKWPFIVKSLDSCPAKDATSLAYPPETYPPYVFGGEFDSTVPRQVIGLRSYLGLCAAAGTTKFFCPSHQNPGMKNVVEWNYNRLFPYGKFDDGSIWRPFGIIECFFRCKAVPQGTAFIGDGPYGVVS